MVRAMRKVMATLAFVVTVTAALPAGSTIACGAPAHSNGAPRVSTTSSTPKPFNIVDRVLNMDAYTFYVPSNWMTDGAVIQGSDCAAGPFPTFRALSPDGLSGMKVLPRLDWSWSNMQSQQFPQCAAFAQQMSASDFAQHMVKVLGVEFVRENPPPARLADMRRNAAAMDARTPGLTTTDDIAEFLVRYKINSITIEEILEATVQCFHKTPRLIPGGQFHNCSATVVLTWAPQGQLEATRAIIQSMPHLVVHQDWNQRWTQVVIDKMNSDNASVMQRKASEFQDAQAMRQRQHQQFMDTMAEGTRKSMERTADSMNQRARVADDWCDYSLDLQKRRDPVTGEITKDSSAYNYTWVNQNGDRVQTNNINSNPNGRGTGDWTLQDNVR